MKKTILSIVFLLILLLVPTMVFAAEEVAQVGEEKFTLLDEAIEAAKNNGEDIIILKTINVNEDVTINIEGVNIKGDVNPLFLVNNGSLTIEGKGTVSALNGDAFSLLGNTASDWQTKAIKANIKINTNISVIARDNCIYLKGNGAVADVYGSLTTTKKGCAVIQGNGTVGNGLTEINVYEGANILNDYDVAIYHPQSGDLNVYGGNIKGLTGIEMRAGNLYVDGGTIVGTGVPIEVTPNGNGSTSFGAGIAIAQHNTKLETNTIVNGGTVQGYSAFYQSNPEKNDEASIAKISITINGGKFETINGGKVTVYSENKTGFITGGNFNTTVGDLKAEGYVEKQNSKGSFDVYKEHTTTVENNDSIGVVQTETVKETLNASLQLNADLNKKVQNAIQNGKDISIGIEIEELDEKLVTEEEKVKISQNIASHQKIHQYFDISVLVKADQEKLGNITELTEKMKFSIKISADLIKEGRSFYILKLHGDKVERIDGVLNGENLEFETSQFSTFALAYEDGNGGGSTIAEEKDDTPKTGEINTITYVWATLVVIAVVGLMTTKKPSKHSK